MLQIWVISVKVSRRGDENHDRSLFKWLIWKETWTLTILRRGDETGNARRNGNRNPRWSSQVSYKETKWLIWKETLDFKWLIWKETLEDLDGPHRSLTKRLNGSSEKRPELNFEYRRFRFAFRRTFRVSSPLRKMVKVLVSFQMSHFKRNLWWPSRISISLSSSWERAVRVLRRLCVWGGVGW